jgi:methyl-accepting chemotaxis protein
LSELKIAHTARLLVDSVQGHLHFKMKLRRVSAVVMATEQGTRAVESGVEQSILTGEPINSLFDTVATSVQAATVINASSNEQLAGTEKASKAMVSIEQTMRENLYGTSQVEESPKKLEDLGESPDRLVKCYRV